MIQATCIPTRQYYNLAVRAFLLCVHEARTNICAQILLAPKIEMVFVHSF